MIENAQSIDQFIVLGAVFFLITLLGFYAAYLYGRKTKQFRWREYIAIIVWPIFAVFGLAYFIDQKVFILFLLSSFVGFALEYVLGFVYHKTLNKRLWTYTRLSIQEYTSLLPIPLWGIVGVVFWFLGEVIGL
jgi:uncharacterized membrane protein YjfL (UPF0719 family)